MSRLETKAPRCSRRVYLCREHPAPSDASPVADYLEYDACLDRGGRWLMHAHACIEQGDGQLPEAPEAL